MSSTTLDRVTVHSYLGEGDEKSLADDVLDGLTRPFKELPPKHFYDAHGADLFDRICEQPEYYPTRTERSILQDRAAELVERTGMEELVELGSGTAAKTRILLQAMEDAGAGRGSVFRYVPLDVTEGMVRSVAADLTAIHPELVVHGIVGDFERHLHHVPAPDGPRVVAFLGGTLGNFIPGTRRRFLRRLAGLLRPQDALLIGHDLVKDPEVIEAAYNDAAGVTAAFNRNVLTVLNRELDGNLDPEGFEHVAFFDREHEWIEMRLRATRQMDARLEELGLDVRFSAREELRTEISAKFTRERLVADLAAAGLELDELLTDPDELYGLSLSRPATAG